MKRFGSLRFYAGRMRKAMNIARTTVQGIYNEARYKLADSLVHGKILTIEGGDYQLCDGLEKTCRCGGCLRHRCGRGFNSHGKNEEA